MVDLVETFSVAVTFWVVFLFERFFVSLEDATLDFFVVVFFISLFSSFIKSSVYSFFVVLGMILFPP